MSSHGWAHQSGPPKLHQPFPVHRQPENRQPGQTPVLLSAILSYGSVQHKEAAITSTATAMGSLLMRIAAVVRTWMRRSLSRDCKAIPFALCSINVGLIFSVSGGGCEKDGQGVLVQKTRHTRKDTIVKCVLNTMAAQMPVGVVIGNRNTVCPSAVPHRYNVLAFFRITHVWFEGIGDSAGARVRLEKVDLDAQSWWMPQGMIPRPPLKQRTDAGPVSTFPCLTCGEYSPQVYAEGWMCLEESCSRFWKINGSNEPAHFTYNAQFLTARTLNPSNNHAPHGLAPSLIEKFGGTDPLQTTARCSWRGAVCPLCRRCNSRIYWDGWKCENEACAWDHIGTRMALPLVSVMDDADFTGPGAHPPFIGSRNELRPVMSFMKGYQRHNYTLPGIGTVTHYAAKGVINRRRGGPDEMFKMLQTTEGLGLRRYPLKQSVGKCKRIFYHFLQTQLSLNYLNMSQRRSVTNKYIPGSGRNSHLPLRC